MAGVSFDDLTAPKKTVSFDDLYQEPQKQAEVGNAAGAGKAFAYGLSGGAVPFGNVITSALAAGAISPFVPETYGQLYDQAQADTKATQEANPNATLAGNITGIASSLPLGFTKALSGKVATTGVRGAINQIPQIGNFVGRGEVAAGAGAGLAKRAAVGTVNTALRGIKGAALAAPTGFAYGAGEADSGKRMEGGVEAARDAALIGGGAAAGLPVLGSAIGYGAQGVRNVYKGVKARDVEALENAAQGIKAGSRRAYNAMKANGALFSPQASSRITQEITDTLNADGILNQGLHGKTISVLNDLKVAAQKPNFGLEELDQWRRLLGQVAGNVTPDNLQDARKASIVIDALDDAVDGIKQSDLVNGTTEAVNSLNLGRKEYARARKFENITDIIRKSDGDANYLKRELKKFSENPKKTRGFSPVEINALQDAARLSGGEGILKMLGKFGFDTGASRIGAGVGAVVGSAAAGAATGGAGAIAAPVVGTLARQSQKMIARGKAEDLLKIIEAGGQITQKQIMALPPAQAKALLQLAKQQPSILAKSSIILNNNE